MKKNSLLILIACALIFFACKEKSTSEKLVDSVEETIKQTSEYTKEVTDESLKLIKETYEETQEATEEEVKNIQEDVEDHSGHGHD